MTIFFPFVNLVDVDVLLTLVAPPPPPPPPLIPFENELWFMVLNDVNPAGLCEKKSSIRVPPNPKPKPNGLKRVELTAFWG